MSARKQTLKVVPAANDGDNLNRIQALSYEIDALAHVVRIGTSDIAQDVEIDEGRLLVLTEILAQKAEELSERAGEM